MKIQLFLNYGGWNTNEQRIPPGIYDSSDPALMGLAVYLVENGHAAVVGESLADLPDGAVIEYIEDELIPVNPPATPAPAKPSKAKARK